MATTEVKRRYALFDTVFNEKVRVTDYVWEYVHKKGNFILLSNEKETKIYDEQKKEFIFTVQGIIVNYDEDTGDFILGNNKLYGAYNIDGREILPVKYKDIDWYETYIEVKGDNDMWGAYSYEGTELMPLSFERICATICEDDNDKPVAFEVNYMGKTGYFVINTKKFYEVDEINVTKTGIVEGFKDDKWKVLS